MVIILDSNWLFGLTKNDLLSFYYKKIIFLLYIIEFISISTILIYFIKRDIKKKQIKSHVNYAYFSIIPIIAIISSILIIVFVEISFLNYYHNTLIYIVSFVSFITIIGYLSVLSINFFKWYKELRNNILLLFGVLFILYSIDISISLIFLDYGLSSLPEIITPKSPGGLISSIYLVEPNFQINLSDLYNIIFLISVIFAWSLTVFMIRHHYAYIDKKKLLLMIIFPVLVFILSIDLILDPIFEFFNISIPNKLKIYKDIPDSFFTTLVNSKIQILSLFFALSLLIIFHKLKNESYRYSFFILVIGFILIFSSRDFSSVFLGSVPPNGLIVMSFNCLGAFLLLFGYIYFMKLVSIDKNISNTLALMLKKDPELLKILFSEKRKEEIDKIKSIVALNIKNERPAQNNFDKQDLEEIKEMVEDLLSSLHKRDNEK